MTAQTTISYEGNAEHVSRVIELLRGKWTVHVLFLMRDRPVRLSDLRRSLPKASKKALTASLRYLEAQRLAVRRDLSRNLLHAEYEISEEMTVAIESLLTYLSDWSVGQRK
jgi:DNA-binding HxlR family transcriptional regulator